MCACVCVRKSYCVCVCVLKSGLHYTNRVVRASVRKLYNNYTLSHCPLHNGVHSSSPTVPRPNLNIFFSPLHVNIDQRSCLWLVEFVYGVVHTVNMTLAISAHDEGKSFIVSFFRLLFLQDQFCYHFIDWIEFVHISR